MRRIGVDADSGLVHIVTNMTASANNVTQTTHLLPDQETVVLADAGYRTKKTD